MLLAVLFAATWQVPPPPVPSDPRLVVELIAQEPDIVTPAGLAVDRRGRIWVVENHTHMRPKDYAGPPSDRLRIFDDFGPDGRARKVTTFAEGFEQGMNLSIGRNGDVYLVTRNAIELFPDPDSKGNAGRHSIVRLETVGDYPHNGLFGLALDPRGNLYFALGRNTGRDHPLGAPWTLVGTDGSRVSGTEGGRIFRCRPDGSKLAPVATGFWNTYHLAFDAFGRLFAVDNDPGVGSECRLLHIVSGGDYGFRPRAGYRESHPFISWNGERPGTLPVVAFTGEAPAGILACESDAMPAALRGALLVTSWGDHQVERFRLEPHGSSFTSRREPVLRGGEDFRPVGIAQAPDGSLCISDWVDRSYPVHGRGRLWRVRPKVPESPDPLTTDPRARFKAYWTVLSPTKDVVESGLKEASEEIRGEAVRHLAEDDPRRLSIAVTDPSSQVRLQALLGMKPTSALPRVLFGFLADPDPFVVAAAISALGRGGSELLRGRMADENPRIRIGVLAALRRTGEPTDPAIVRTFLRDADPAVRREAIQWAGEEGLSDLTDDLAAAASRPPTTPELFESFLGALEFFDPAGRNRIARESHLARILGDPSQPALFHAYALRMLRPDHPLLAASALAEWVKKEDPAVRLEAVRTLSVSATEPSQEILRTLAADPRTSAPLRIEAAVGLARSASSSSSTRQLLVSFLKADDVDLQGEAIRSLGGVIDDPSVREAFLEFHNRRKDRPDLFEKAALLLNRTVPNPLTNAEWKAVAREKGDPQAGERLFFHPRGPQCVVCHRVQGRGGVVGPDLSRVSRRLDRDWLAESILEPSKEVAPDYVAWDVTTREGDSWIGRILRDDVKSVTMLVATGQTVSVKRADITGRRPCQASLMPEGLQRFLTRKEFRDLVEFLSGLR